MQRVRCTWSRISAGPLMLASGVPTHVARVADVPETAVTDEQVVERRTIIAGPGAKTGVTP
jgi:hypothetical protein